MLVGIFLRIEILCNCLLLVLHHRSSCLKIDLKQNGTKEQSLFGNVGLSVAPIGNHVVSLVFLC